MRKISKLLLLILAFLLVIVPFKASAQTATSWNGWQRVADTGFGKGADYYGTYPFITFTQYQSWIISTSSSDTRRAEVYKSTNGTTWEQSGQSGFGENNFFIYATAIHDGMLYASTLHGTKGSQIWRTWDTIGWEKVTDNSFGYGNQAIIFALTSFNGYLYAGVNEMGNSGIGGQIFRSQNGKEGWTRVTTPGAGQPTVDSLTFTMVDFNNYLYVSYATLGGGQIYRTKDGTNWEWVTGRGFDDPQNQDIFLGVELNGELYAGTDQLNLDGDFAGSARVYKTSDGIHWQRVVTPPNMNYQTWFLWPTVSYNGWIYFGTTTQASGGEVWRYNGSTWEQIADGGFGDHNSSFVYVGVVKDGFLYAGTQNTVSGGSIWRKEVGGISTGPATAELPQTGADL